MSVTKSDRYSGNAQSEKYRKDGMKIKISYCLGFNRVEIEKDGYIYTNLFYPGGRKFGLKDINDAIKTIEDERL
jgi:hypothetical protein